MGVSRRRGCTRRLHTDDGTKYLYHNKASSRTPMTDEELEEARRLRDVINEAIQQVEEELARLKEIHRDMERARKQMEQEKKEERVLSPIKTIRFGDVREKGSGETSVIGQSFEAVHTSVEKFSGAVKNIFDFGTVILFDRYESAFFELEDPSDAAEEVAEAVVQESDAAAGIRMDATSRQRPKRDFLSPEPGH